MAFSSSNWFSLIAHKTFPIEFNNLLVYFRSNGEINENRWKRSLTENDVDFKNEHREWVRESWGWGERFHKVNGLTGTKCNQTFFCHLKVIEALLLLLLMGTVLLLFFQKKRVPFVSMKFETGTNQSKSTEHSAALKRKILWKTLEFCYRCVCSLPSLSSHTNSAQSSASFSSLLCVAFYLLLAPVHVSECVSMSSMSKITVLYTI